MQNTKSIVTITLIMFTVIMSTSSIFSYEKLELPNNIKIGLFFDKTAKSTLSLESKTGFKVSTFYKDKFNEMFDLDQNKISLEKNKSDSYYIQIGSDLADYSQADDFLRKLDRHNINGYLSFDDNWKVFVGPFLSELNANKESEEINSDSDYKTKVVDEYDNGVHVLNEKGNIIFMYNSNNEVYFSGQDTKEEVSVVNVEGTYYRGGITAKRLSNSDMTVINTLPLEEYLYGVIPGEMPVSWPIEALKAQAVAARGFALSNFNKYEEFDFNLCNTVNSQVYKGYSVEKSNSNRAVDETKGKVVTYRGKIIEHYYHSNSGGQTENSENVWSTPLPYIKGVTDEFSLDSPHSTWSVVFTADEIKSALEKHNIDIGDVLGIEVTSLSNNGRVLSLTMYGTKGEEVLEKQKSRTVLGLKSNYFSVDSNNANNSNNDSEISAVSGNSYEVKSINLKDKYIITADGMYEIESSNEISIFNGEEYKTIKEESANLPADTFIINGKGYGHGLGMSQYGAKKMAQLGYKYDEILKHYYTDVEVE